MGFLNYIKNHLQTILIIAEATAAIILIVLILLQSKGAGLSELFGGSVTNIYRTKRGFEKFIYRLTIVMAILFIALAFSNLLVTK